MARSDRLAVQGASILRTLLLLLLTSLSAVLFGACLLRDLKASQILSEDTPASARDALNRIHQAYEAGVKEGRYIPFTYPMWTFGGCIFLAFLLVPPTSRFHNKTTRCFTFLTVLSFYCWVIQNCRAQNVLPGFGIGILSSWAIVWTATTVIFHDGKSEYMRIAMVDKDKAKSTPSSNLKLAFTIVNNAVGNLKGAKDAQIAVSKALGSSDLTLAPSTEEFNWQSYPAIPFASRLSWAVDILTTTRGAGWNWRIAHLPPLPPHVRNSLIRNQLIEGSQRQVSVSVQYVKAGNKMQDLSDNSMSHSGIVRFDSYWGVILHNIYVLAKGFFFLDVLLTIGHQDPYFWGIVDPYPPGPSYLPSLVLNSSMLLRIYRLIISMGMISLSLQTICALVPLIFVGCLGPCVVGSNGHAWLYADHFGNFEHVFSRGLAGWWGSWWHQNFRYAFKSGGIWVCSLVSIRPLSSTGGAIQLFVAFTLSGLCHAAGSISMIPETQPWRGSFFFFVLQPVGILAEKFWKVGLIRLGLSDKIPRPLAYWANFMFVHVWFYYTAPLVTDDFARGGIWLYEPVAISFIRGLGLGAKGDGFFCWKGKWLGWHSDAYQRWWLSGVSF